MITERLTAANTDRISEAHAYVRAAVAYDIRTTIEAEDITTVIATNWPRTEANTEHWLTAIDLGRALRIHLRRAISARSVAYAAAWTQVALSIDLPNVTRVTERPDAASKKDRTVAVIPVLGTIPDLPHEEQLLRWVYGSQWVTKHIALINQTIPTVVFDVQPLLEAVAEVLIDHWSSADDIGDVLSERLTIALDDRGDGSADLVVTTTP